MAAEDPVNVNSARNDILDNFDLAFLVIFIFEMVAKIIVYGLVLGPRSYLRSRWNILDCFVVISGDDCESFVKPDDNNNNNLQGYDNSDNCNIIVSNNNNKDKNDNVDNNNNNNIDNNY